MKVASFTMLLLKPLLFAASAAAFVVVPELSEADEEFFRALPIEADSIAIPATAYYQSIDLPCKQCHGRDTHLKLDFTIEGHSRLMLNGFQLYPNPDPWNGDLTASVVKASGRQREKKLGYSLAVEHDATDKEQQLDMINVELRIIEVGNRFVEGVSPVVVKLVQAPNGELLMGKEVAFDAGTGADNKKCMTLWCGFNDFVGGAWDRMKSGVKGCGGMRSHGQTGDHRHPHGNPEEMGSHGSGDYHHGGHHHHGSFKHHSDDFRHHSWGTMIRNVTSYIFLPLLMGITAGVGVAILAMFLGSVAFRFFAYVRGVRPQAVIVPVGSSYKAATLEVTAKEDEKSGLMSERDPPPEYQDESARQE